jgi:hypothetical protein
MFRKQFFHDGIASTCFPGLSLPEEFPDNKRHTLFYFQEIFKLTIGDRKHKTITVNGNHVEGFKTVQAKTLVFFILAINCHPKWNYRILIPTGSLNIRGDIEMIDNIIITL